MFVNVSFVKGMGFRSIRLVAKQRPLGRGLFVVSRKWSNPEQMGLLTGQTVFTSRGFVMYAVEVFSSPSAAPTRVWVHGNSGGWDCAPLDHVDRFLARAQLASLSPLARAA